MKPLNSADYPTYHIGDKVTIRQWDDMAAEFGLNGHGGIKVPKVFTMYMKKYCGQTLPIVYVNRYIPPTFDSYCLGYIPPIFDSYCLEGSTAIFSSPMFEQSKLQSVPSSSLSFDSLLQGGDFF